MIALFDTPDPNARLTSAAAALFDVEGRGVAYWRSEQSDLTGGLTVVGMMVPKGRYRLRIGAIDASGGFYKGTVADKAARSHMNLTFLLPSEELTDKFVKEASKNGMVALKGYRTVGGIRASMYNAMPVAGAKALADFMGTFAKANA